MRTWHRLQLRVCALHDKLELLRLDYETIKASREDALVECDDAMIQREHAMQAWSDLLDEHHQTMLDLDDVTMERDELNDELHDTRHHRELVTQEVYRLKMENWILQTKLKDRDETIEQLESQLARLQQQARTQHAPAAPGVVKMIPGAPMRPSMVNHPRRQPLGGNQVLNVHHPNAFKSSNHPRSNTNNSRRNKNKINNKGINDIVHKKQDTNSNKDNTSHTSSTKNSDKNDDDYDDDHVNLPQESLVVYPSPATPFFVGQPIPAIALDQNGSPSSSPTLWATVAHPPLPVAPTQQQPQHPVNHQHQQHHQQPFVNHNHNHPSQQQRQQQQHWNHHRNHPTQQQQQQWNNFSNHSLMLHQQQLFFHPQQQQQQQQQQHFQQHHAPGGYQPQYYPVMNGYTMDNNDVTNNSSNTMPLHAPQQWQ